MKRIQMLMKGVVWRAHRANLCAAALSLLTVVLTAQIATRIFENMLQLIDEVAYLWQAKAIAGGALILPSPAVTSSSEQGGGFSIPFVIDYQGQRFGKYPLGWPMLLALGLRLGLRDWLNPALAGLAVWLIYRLGTKLAGPGVGLLAALLALTSPLFLVNASLLLAHPWALVLTLVLVFGVEQRVICRPASCLSRQAIR